MKQTINTYQFEQAFKNCGRGEQFSYHGLQVLFDYLEEYEDNTGEELELDVIALCCEYSEDTPKDIADNYSIDIEGYEDQSDIWEIVMNYLHEQTMVCGATREGTIVYSQF